MQDQVKDILVPETEPRTLFGVFGPAATLLTADSGIPRPEPSTPFDLAAIIAAQDLQPFRK